METAVGRPGHPERGAEIPGHHRTPAAAGVSVEPQRRLRLEGEHREARHQTVGKARASGLDWIWDAVETLSHRLQHPEHRQMPAGKGFRSCSRRLASPVLPNNAGFRAKSRQESVKKCFRRSGQPIAEQQKTKPAAITGTAVIHQTSGPYTPRRISGLHNFADSAGLQILPWRH